MLANCLSPSCALGRSLLNSSELEIHDYGRMTKTVEAMYADLHVADPPKIGTRAVCATWLALRAEIIQVLELRNKLSTVQRASGPAYSVDVRKKPPKGKVRRPSSSLF